MNKISIILVNVLLILVLWLSHCKNRYVKSEDLRRVTNTDSTFQRGKQLFKSNCAACHSIGMKEVMTAAALGGVTKRRNKEWLYNYTKNSTEMAQNGDSLALELKKIGFGLMPSYPNLSNKDPDAIYYFVEKRYNMTLKGIPTD